MKLRSGHPYWLARDRLPRALPPLESDADCEALVIGGGVTGALCAHMLVEVGFDCILIDKRDFLAPSTAGGSTPASTALLLYELDTPLTELTERIGEEDAARCFLLGLEAINELERLAALIPGGCDFARRKSLYIASKEADAALLEREHRARTRLGFRVDHLSRRDMAGQTSIRAPAALLTHDAAEVNPYRLAHGLLLGAQSRGLRIFEGTRAEQYERAAGETRIVTATGHTIRARHVVFATGYEAHEQLQKYVGRLISTYACVTQPLRDTPGWPEHWLVWETAHPYLYIRSTPDGRAMIGGEDEPISDASQRDALIPRKSAALLARFADLFPDIRAEPGMSWAGFFAQTEDSLPFIGPAPAEQFPGALLALGYGANGITFSVIAARIIRDLITGSANNDARLFRLDRD